MEADNPNQSGLRDNLTRGTVASFLSDKLHDGSELSIVSAYFTIYAYDADQVCVTHYVNGELTKREPLKQAADGLLKIGKATIGNWSVPTARHRRSSVRNFNGCIDELIVFGEALDDQEVRRIYEVGRP